MNTENSKMDKWALMDAAMAAGMDNDGLARLAHILRTAPAESSRPVAEAQKPGTKTVAKKIPGRCNPENGPYLTSPKVRPYFERLRAEALKKPVEGTILSIAVAAGWEGRRSGLSNALAEARTRGNDLLRVTTRWPNGHDHPAQDGRLNKLYVIEAV